MPLFAVGGVPGRVHVAKTANGTLAAEFGPYGSYPGGVAVAWGYIDNDAFRDLVTGATVGNPHVKVYDGQPFSDGTFDPENSDADVLASFFAYGLSFNVGPTWRPVT